MDAKKMKAPETFLVDQRKSFCTQTAKETDSIEGDPLPRDTTVTLTNQFVQEIESMPVPTSLRRQPGHSSGSHSGIPGAHAVITTPRVSSHVQPRQPLHSGTVADEEAHNISASLVPEEEEHGVMDEEADEVPVIEGVSPKSNYNRRRNGWIIIGGLFLLASVTVLVPLLLFVDDNNDKKDDTSSSSAASDDDTIQDPGSSSDMMGQYIYYPPFQEGLPHDVKTAIQNGGDDDPFYKANAWMIQDPYLDSYSAERQKQRYYLAMMYHATNGDSWLRKDNWLSYDVSECLWYSSSIFPTDSRYYPKDICDENNTMISFSMARNNLTGTWPMYYTSFIPYLKAFDIGYNHVGGPLPMVTTTEFLEVIILSQNPLFGAPTVAGGLFSNLKVLMIDGVNLRGNNGGSFMRLTPKLELVNTSGYSYVGEIQSTYGLLTNLHYFNIGHTETVTGQIPTQFGLLSRLKFLDMSSLPGLVGSLPSELAGLTQLTHLDISETPLTGAIPLELCNYTANGQLSIFVDCDQIDCCI